MARITILLLDLDFLVDGEDLDDSIVDVFMMLVAEVVLANLFLSVLDVIVLEDYCSQIN